MSTLVHVLYLENVFVFISTQKPSVNILCALLMDLICLMNDESTLKLLLCTFFQFGLGRVSKTGNGQISATNHRFGMNQTTRCIGKGD